MPHIYELGYGTYEESDYAQLVHRRKFSQMRFEKMVLDCVGQAAKMEYELRQKKWNEDACASHYFEYDDEDDEDGFDDDEEEKISSRKHCLESAMSARLYGEDSMYEYNIKEAYLMRHSSLSYQDIHRLVVSLMCDTYGFSPVKKLRSVQFNGWGCLTQVQEKQGVMARASRIVKKVLSSMSVNFRKIASAEAKWIARRKSAIDKNPAAGDIMDSKLCDKLGVEFIPYNHPDAVKARIEYNTHTSFSQVMDEFIAAFDDGSTNNG